MLILRVRGLTRKSLGVFNSLMRSAQGIVQFALVIKSSTFLRQDRDKDISVYPDLSRVGSALFSRVLFAYVNSRDNSIQSPVVSLHPAIFSFHGMDVSISSACRFRPRRNNS